MVKERFQNSIRFRFLSILFAILFIGTLGLSIVIAINERREQKNTLLEHGQSLASLLARQSRDSLVLKDYLHLDVLVNDLHKEDIVYSVIRDEQGNLLTSQFASVNYQFPRFNKILSQLPRDSGLQDIVDGVKKMEPIMEISVPVMVGVTPVGEVTIGMSEYRLNKQVARVILFIVSLNAAVALVLGVMMFVASKKILLDPIAELTRATSVLADGDLSTRVKVDTIGEVKLLADRFNQMLSSLEKVTVSKDYVDTIIKSIIDTLIVLSPDKNIIMANDATAALLGYEEKELIGKPIAVILDGGATTSEPIIDEVISKGLISSYETKYITKDGAKVPMLFSGSTMYVKNKMYGIVCVAKDITGRIKTEEELRRKTEELAETSESRRHALESQKRFLASMSHEIRTPLNSIIGFGDVLSTTSLDAYQRQLLQYTQKSADHLLSLINDVLDVSKIDAGQLNLKMEPFDLREIMVECLAIISSRGQKTVKFLHEIPKMDFLVVGDAMRIKQIFLNLLGNAAKFTENGYVKLSLMADEDIGTDGAAFRFCVEDTGIGIPEDRIQYLFTPFKQMHSSRYGGTGLGLYLSRSIARMMDGDIEVVSKEGVGTKFYVSFVLGTIPKPSGKETAARRWEVAADRFSALKVLVVEDVEMNVLLAQAMLQTFFSIRPDIAHDGVEAVKMAKAATYDVILMDMQMPFMDGITATKEIRKAGIQIPIIAVSANALSDEISRALDAGMNDYITKPLKKEAIEEALSKLSFAGRGNMTDNAAVHVTDTPAAEPGDMKETAVRYFMENLGCGEERARAMLLSSIDSVRTSLKALEEAIASGEIDFIQRVLHALIDGLLNSGLEKQAMLASELNGLLKTAGDIEEVRQRAEGLFEALRVFC